jgi:hypothetical protein
MRLASLTVAMALALCAIAQELDDKSLKKKISAVADLRASAQVDALRALLRNKDYAEAETETLIQTIFFYEHGLRGSLRSLLTDSSVGDEAFFLLPLIGDPEDIRFMIHASPAQQKTFPDQWAYGVACSMLQPASQDEWDFLRKAALDEFDDTWSGRGAIQSLKLIATLESRRILEDVQKKNVQRAQSVSEALSYIRSRPSSMTGSDLNELAVRVGRAAKVGNWEGNGEPVFNQAGDKALVSIAFRAERDEYVYAATFHKIGGAWKLRGLREISQALIPPIPVKH